METDRSMQNVVGVRKVSFIPLLINAVFSLVRKKSALLEWGYESL